MSRESRRELLSLALAVTAVAAVAVLVLPPSVSRTSAQAVGHPDASLVPAVGQQHLLDSEEQAFVERINGYRAENGVPPLNPSPTLNSAARWMSEDMATNDRADHVDSLGRHLSQRMADFSYSYETWKGENLAAGSGTATRTFELWRDSPTHNRNMLNPNFVVIGVARAYDPDSTYGWYWATNFGGFDDEFVDPELTFDGQSFMSALPASADLATVTGELQDGTPFRGADVVEAVGTVTLAAGWNYACYAGSQQAIDAALAPILSQVLAVYRLRDDGSYDYWFPGKPELSTITTVQPFESLLILMSGGASWPQDVFTMSPAGADLVMGWNSVCYGGLTEPVEEGSASISTELDILYTLGSDQLWRSYVPGRFELTNISDLAHLTSVLALVSNEEGATWTFDLIQR